MAGQWEPAGGSGDDDPLFGEVDAIVFSNTDAGPAELRYQPPANTYDDIPEDRPAPTRKQRRSEGAWSPGGEVVPKKKRRSNPFLKRLLPLITVAITFGVIGAFLLYVANLVGQQAGTTP